MAQIFKKLSVGSLVRGEISFAESFMFDEPRNVKAVTITMRHAQSWGDFGINSAELMAKPAMFMIAQLAGSYFHVPFAVVVDHPRVLCEE